MFKIFENLLNVLAVVAIAVFGFTIFCQVKFKDSNWQIVRIASNVFLIFYELIFMAIHYFSSESVIIDLICLVIWIINFAISYCLWQNSKNN